MRRKLGDVRGALTRHRNPLWLYPSLLSLDAPLVAMAWLYVFAKAWRVNYLPWTAYAALAIAVWVVHVVERLHRAKRREAYGLPLGERHAFHRRHARGFLAIAVFASLGLVALVLVALPMSIFGYLVICGVLVAGYFVMSRIEGGHAHDIAYGKHFLAGAAFAYGIAMIAHVFLPAVGKHDLVTSREFLTFAVLCVIHLCAIDFWEKSALHANDEEGASGELSLILPVIMLAIVALGFAISGHQQSVRPFYYAILTGAALIHVINRNRAKFTAAELRSIADLAMLAPALVFHAYPPV
ncbi:MAG: hypothetical protein ACNA8L_10045 [Luteolibacter sp.]